MVDSITKKNKQDYSPLDELYQEVVINNNFNVSTYPSQKSKNKIIKLNKQDSNFNKVHNITDDPVAQAILKDKDSALGIGHFFSRMGEGALTKIAPPLSFLKRGADRAFGGLITLFTSFSRIKKAYQEDVLVNDNRYSNTRKEVALSTVSALAGVGTAEVLYTVAGMVGGPYSLIIMALAPFMVSQSVSFTRKYLPSVYNWTLNHNIRDIFAGIQDFLSK